jgi:glycine cleavage system H protein
MDPKDLRYSSEHEWVASEGEDATLGITEFAQKELGDIVFVDLPEVGQSFGAGDEIGTIESVKAVAELFAPVAGEISEVNEALADAPETINADPYGEGWLLRFRPADPKEVEGLMDAEAYAAFCEKGES